MWEVRVFWTFFPCTGTIRSANLKKKSFKIVVWIQTTANVFIQFNTCKNALITISDPRQPWPTSVASVSSLYSRSCRGTGQLQTNLMGSQCVYHSLLRHCCVNLAYFHHLLLSASLMHSFQGMLSSKTTNWFQSFQKTVPAPGQPKS